MSSRPSLFLFVFLALFFTFTGCKENFKTQEPRELESGDQGVRKPLVLVSIAPYKFLVQKISGEICDVQTIIPPRFNPHTFEPTSRQIAEIAQSQIWFRLGEPFETKALSSLDSTILISDLRDGIELQSADGDDPPHCSTSEGKDHLDRHIWLSPKLAGQQAATIAETLSNRFPEKREQFQANLANFLEELGQLDAEIRSALAPLQDRSMIVSHSAFGYFCREYCLEQLSIEQKGKEPSPKRLQAMLEKASRFRPAIALALPQHNNKGVQIIAKKMNVPIRVVDPYATDFLETMRNLARVIADPHYERVSAEETL